MSAPAIKSKILIVEDDELVALFVQLKVEMLGYQSLGCTSRGEDAIRLAGELKPNLILMDIRLAGEMDGIDAAYAIHQQFSLPVVFLTSNVSDDRQSCGKANVSKQSDGVYRRSSFIDDPKNRAHNSCGRD